MFGLGKLATRNSWPKHEAEWQLASPCQQPTRGCMGPHPAVCHSSRQGQVPKYLRPESTLVYQEPPTFLFDSIGSISWGSYYCASSVQLRISTSLCLKENEKHTAS